MINGFIVAWITIVEMENDLWKFKEDLFTYGYGVVVSSSLYVDVTKHTKKNLQKFLVLLLQLLPYEENGSSLYISNVCMCRNFPFIFTLYHITLSISILYNNHELQHLELKKSPFWVIGQERNKFKL